MMINKPLIGLLAGSLGASAYVPYVGNIVHGRTRPHIFTWLIWSLLSGIAFAAQLAEKAGPGLWVTGLNVFGSVMILLMALGRGDRNITRSDWLIFLVALTAIPLWRLTQNPLWSVVLVCVIDVLAFIPTFRKSWSSPHQETLKTYALGAATLSLSIVALETYNWTTVLYPATLAVSNIVFVLMALARRRTIAA